VGDTDSELNLNCGSRPCIFVPLTVYWDASILSSFQSDRVLLLFKKNTSYTFDWVDEKRYLSELASFLLKFKL
jgi:hypothetical protein